MTTKCAQEINKTLFESNRLQMEISFYLISRHTKVSKLHDVKDYPL